MTDNEIARIRVSVARGHLALGEFEDAWRALSRVEAECLGDEGRALVDELIATAPQGSPVQASARALAARLRAEALTAKPSPSEPGATSHVSPGPESQDAEPQDAEPLDAEPQGAEPLDAEPLDAEPLDAEPLDAEPLDAEPLDAEPLSTASDDAESPEPESVGAESLEPEQMWADSPESAFSQADELDADAFAPQLAGGEVLEGDPRDARAALEAAFRGAEPPRSPSRESELAVARMTAWLSRVKARFGSEGVHDVR